MSRIVILPDVYSTHLSNKRDIYIYLPASYDVEHTKHYPVLYAQDGQHMFHADDRGGSWDIHLTADRLIENDLIKEVIIVGIASIMDARASEYFHKNASVEHFFQTQSKGDVYEKFVIEELKPLIDMQFRTLPDQENTAIMGSSAGGLISYHLAFHHPHIFGQVAILSPFFVHSELINGELKEVPLYEQFNSKPPIKVWLDIGRVEGLIMVDHVRTVADQLLSLGFKQNEDFAFFMDEEAGHTQQDWANRMASILIFFYGNKGTPVHLKLSGRKKVGLNSAHYKLYPNVKFDFGYQFSLLQANYTVENTHIASIDKDGTIYPHQIGKTKVKVEYEGFFDEMELEVIDYLADTVTIDITVHVPENTPSDAQIFAGVEIPKLKNGIYHGKFILPRDLKFDVLVSRGFTLHEKRTEKRKFSTEDDLKLHFKVIEWEEGTAFERKQH